MGKVSLYFHTIINMKPSQVFNRIRKKLGMGCPLGMRPSKSITSIQALETPEFLDFDPAFLSRFPAEELIRNKITLLHSSKIFDCKSRWVFDDKSALWNYNLHYFEYLFSLVKEWKDTGDKKYLDKTKEIINGWIDNNPEGTFPAWESYTISLRIVTWISYYSYVCGALDRIFLNDFLESLHDQYVYLSNHLEKDILGNHYFENLKSLIIASLFFNDDCVLKKALTKFKTECQEEILSDGMHFELSPMYHKIILEGILRVAIALRGTGKKDIEIEGYLQSMLDVAYSFENGLERVPLFNDCGNNVAKSLEALVKTTDMLGFKPEFKGQLKASGFYIFEKSIGGQTWKLIVDAGQPGPKYIPGHAHCDAMSFELFCDGKPVVVNCGTYAYQCKERSFFRSTAAHNTVMVDGTEQSQCWGAFRLAKRSSTKVLDVTDSSITMEMTDQKGQKVKRTIEFTDTELHISDQAEGKQLTSFIHLTAPISTTQTAEEKTMEQFYAPDYGVKYNITVKEFEAEDTIDVKISLEK